MSSKKPQLRGFLLNNLNQIKPNLLDNITVFELVYEKNNERVTKKKTFFSRPPLSKRNSSPTQPSLLSGKMIWCNHMNRSRKLCPSHDDISHKSKKPRFRGFLLLNLNQINQCCYEEEIAFAIHPCCTQPLFRRLRICETFFSPGYFSAQIERWPMSLTLRSSDAKTFHFRSIPD